MNSRMKLKPFVIPTLYGIAAMTLIISGLFLFKENPAPTNQNKDVPIYVNKETIDQDNVPVIGTNVTIARPYNDANVKILRTFYDYKADQSKQQSSLIFYENTYMQNSGVDYGYDKAFDVLSILDGTVVDVKEDNVLGKLVEIRHSNDLISEYQCLDEVSVKANDTVSQGQVIGKSGACNIAKDLNNHLHFELYYKGAVVDPETFFDKNLKDL